MNPGIALCSRFGVEFAYVVSRSHHALVQLDSGNATEFAAEFERGAIGECQSREPFDFQLLVADGKQIVHQKQIALQGGKPALRLCHVAVFF